ncbi:MAG: hypothetical protein ACYDIC_19150 [Desulfobaccales bacterium]
MIVPQKRAERGSQKWIQNLVNACPSLLNEHIKEKIAPLSGREICWVSPLEHDFAEYRDKAFLNRLNLQELTEDLSQFWPKNGPQWDALGKTADDQIFLLIEAKANVPELLSFCGAKDKESLKTISASLDETQQWLNCRDPHIDWNCGFYQYANRLAHLYFLREKNQKEAYLIFLYFLNDTTHIRTSREAWDSALQLQKKLMGLSTASLVGKVIDIFINVKEIKQIND